jgi:cytochrome c-type biogenesis protein CcmE
MQKSVHPMDSIKQKRKWIFGGLIVIAAFVYLVFSATKSQTQYFLTVDELLFDRNEYLLQKVRVSGAVLGETINYIPEETQLLFTVVHIPGDHQQISEMGGMNTVLNQAVKNPDLNRLQVRYYGLLPELLQDEAQAIMTGALQDDGVFLAEEILFKCPSKYEEEIEE